MGLIGNEDLRGPVSALGLSFREAAEEWGGTSLDPVVEPAPPKRGRAPKKPEKPRYRTLSWDRLDEACGDEYEFLIDDFLTAGEKSVVGGASKSGKSFLAIHAAMSIARGVPFFGRPAKHGLVVYQVGEGIRGFRKRLRAYRKHFEVAPDEPVAFEMVLSKIDLWRPDADTEPFIAEIKRVSANHPVPLRLVVIDTLATATGGADENSFKDMGAVMANIDRIAHECNCAVMLVHHMNAGGAKLRGHTSVYANLDQAIFVSCDENKVRTVKLDKQKDDEDGIEFKFELLRVILGEQNGREVSSCVVVDVGEKQKLQAKYGFELRNAGEHELMRAMLATLKRHGRQAPSELGLPLGSEVCPVKELRTEFFASSSVEAKDDKTRDQTIRQRFQRAGEYLRRFHVIDRRGEWIWLTGKSIKGYPETYSRDHERALRDRDAKTHDKAVPTGDKGEVLF